MEIIGYGILFALGFYFAPLIFAMFALVATAIMVSIAMVFRTLFGGHDETKKL